MKFKYLSIIILSIILTSCVQLQELSRLSQCKFDFESVNQIKLANINIENVSDYSSLGFSNIAKLVSGFASGNLPLTLNVEISAKNPNSKRASMTNMDWIAIIDDIEVARGIINKTIVIPSNNVPTKITLPISVNLMELLKGDNQSKILNFGMNLAGQGNSTSRIKVKIKPSINVGGQIIQSPAYITLTKKI